MVVEFFCQVEPFLIERLKLLAFSVLESFECPDVLLQLDSVVFGISQTFLQRLGNSQ